MSIIFLNNVVASAARHWVTIINFSSAFLANVFEPQNVKMVRFVQGGEGIFGKSAKIAQTENTHTKK